MASYLITNQHQPEECQRLCSEIGSFYAAEEPNVQCTCMSGEHEMFFFVWADGSTQALSAIPPGFLQTANTVRHLEDAYAMALAE